MFEGHYKPWLGDLAGHLSTKQTKEVTDYHLDVLQYHNYKIQNKAFDHIKNFTINTISQQFVP